MGGGPRKSSSGRGMEERVLEAAEVEEGHQQPVL